MVATLPDETAVLGDYYRSHADMVPLHGGRVGTALPAGSLPSLRLASLGGTEAWPWEGDAEVQVECWGGTQAQASTLARTAAAAAYGLRGPVTGGHVITAYPSLRPMWSPDPETARPRYIIQVRMTITTGA